MRRRIAWLVLLACSCAGAPPTRRPAGAEPQAPTESAMAVDPSAQRDPFAAEWDAPQKAAHAATAAEMTTLSRGEQEPSTEEERGGVSEAEAAFSREMARVRELVSERRLDQATAAWSEARKGVSDLPPALNLEAASLDFDLAKARADGKGARRAAERWLLQCGPERADACRQKALSAWGSSLKLKPLDPKGKALIEQTRKRDQCLQSAEARKAGPVPVCLDEALAGYRRSRDRLMGARAAWAKARLSMKNAKGPSERARRLASAERLCPDPRCAAFRATLLKDLVRTLLEAGQPEAAARAAFKEMKLSAPRLPPTEREYAWTAEVERSCRALDEAKGPGSCRALERKVNGRYAFLDYSRRRAQGLAPAVVGEVSAHYGVTVQECLAAEATRLVPPSSVTYRVRWTVRNDGRVDRVTVDGQEGRDVPVARCLVGQLSRWRYPRYSGEFQNVEQAFVVHARAGR
ncbi:MAG TPA: hypothetical protein VEY30_09365 [Myxococcaceae bacterium]|nr:hypothetical protein [Myxococcaceae bacterium]